jgi:hypothetical protein
MSTCPKCAQGRMSGPTYGRSSSGVESLAYRCTVCGYSMTTPTVDQQYQATLHDQYMREFMRRQDDAFRSRAQETKPPADPPMKDITPKAAALPKPKRGKVEP